MATLTEISPSAQNVLAQGPPVTPMNKAHHALLPASTPPPTPEHNRRDDGNDRETPATVKKAIDLHHSQSSTQEKAIITDVECKPAPEVLYGSQFLLPPCPSTNPPLLTVVLDLDETLVSNRVVGEDATLRPYVLDALAALRYIPRVELVLWTASTEATAAPVVEQLAVNGFQFDALIYRSPLWFTHGVHTKDLLLLGRPLDRVLLCDNSPQCCKLYRGNCILIEDFLVNPKTKAQVHQHQQNKAAAEVDCSLYHLVATVGMLVKDIVYGSCVPEALHACALHGRHLGMVRYPAPKASSRSDGRPLSPLHVPVQGDFYKLHTMRS